MPTGLLTERSLTQTSTQTSRRDFIDDLDAPIQPIAYETQPQFLPLRMNETLSLSPCTPAPGEIFVFRFRSQWQRVSAHDSAQWLTQDETRRAALLPSPALRYRYVSSRAVLRLAVARMLGCQPDAVDLRDDAKGRMFAQDATGDVVLCADIAYAGVWIMLGISASYLGLGTSLPSYKIASDDEPLLPSQESSQVYRHRMVCSLASNERGIIVCLVPPDIARLSIIQTLRQANPPPLWLACPGARPGMSLTCLCLDNSARRYAVQRR
jgi:hypothetical protein